MNWDDLRFALSVAEAGSIAGAARDLGVNRTTVLRRINAFEKSINVRLFERIDSEYTLTPEAEQLLQAARAISGTIDELERKIVGRELKLEGLVRVTTTDSMLLSVVAAPLASFNKLHPHISLELVITNSVLNLMRRDADVAIRPSLSPPELLIGRCVGDLVFGIYGASAYLDRYQSGDIAAHRWLAVDDSMSGSPPGRWVTANVPVQAVAMRADSFVALQVAAEQGLGLAILPCCLADASADLHRLACGKEDIVTGLWVLTHEDLRGSARVRAFTDHMTRALAAQREILEGTASRGADSKYQRLN
ncbi:MAG: LysR family transcriptional regulator [Gammaproteobacteria bacterium]|nr:LysR family transcriptional regulator [Gammaproteobacteria bacterium]